MSTNFSKVGPAILALSLVLVGAFATRGQDEGRGGLSRFMRQKLEHSQRVLEGLALEDFAMIAENARKLKELSEDARWRVSPNINYLRLGAIPGPRRGAGPRCEEQEHRRGHTRLRAR